MIPHRNKGGKANRMYQFISLIIQLAAELSFFSLALLKNHICTTDGKTFARKIYL
jgi:hypothetical protein